MTSPFSGDDAGSARRISSRYMFETRIQICVHKDNQKTIVGGWTRDLSESGLRAYVAQALVLGELVTLDIPVPSSDRQVIQARVVRTLGTDYGFQFTSLSAEQRASIRAMLKGRSAIPYHSAGL